MLQYEIVDVFTDRPYAGNPLAVVLDGHRLSTDQMQALAREFHLSETAFPLPSSAADYRLRIFTPETELPFAGHPSVGTAHTLARLGRIPAGDVVQECGAGLLPVHIGAEVITLVGGTPKVGGELDPGPLLAAVGLSAADFAGPPPRLAGCGISFAYLSVHAAALARAVPDPARLRLLGLDSGLSVSAWDPRRRAARTRVFAGAVGVFEDPATGSAALGYGVWLVAAGLVARHGTADYTVVQGVEMLRPSMLDCTVTAEDGQAVRATVAGRVVPVASGTIREP
ncbi:MAG: PhzF family phenazine biosynthesis protein [Pseudonocardiales bacterium]